MSTRPDTHKSVTDGELNRAFRIFWSRRYALAEDEMRVPKTHRFTIREMDWMRERKARARRHCQAREAAARGLR